MTIREVLATHQAQRERWTGVITSCGCGWRPHVGIPAMEQWLDHAEQAVREAVA